MNLRDYQKECIDIIQAQKPGAYLIQMATGLGKTVTFANLPRHGRMLILSHREELVHQPENILTARSGLSGDRNTATVRRLSARPYKAWRGGSTGSYRMILTPLSATRRTMRLQIHTGISLHTSARGYCWVLRLPRTVRIMSGWMMFFRDHFPA